MLEPAVLLVVNLFALVSIIAHTKSMSKETEHSWKNSLQNCKRRVWFVASQSLDIDFRYVSEGGFCGKPNADGTRQMLLRGDQGLLERCLDPCLPSGF